MLRKIDDHTRIAFSAIYPDEKQASVLAFLAAALAYYARLGIRFKAVLTDNGPAFRARAFAAAGALCVSSTASPGPIRRRPTARPNVFIHALREWAYARSYQNSNERTQELRSWRHQYNWHRPHSSLGLSPPLSRSSLEDNNLLRLHS